MRPSRRLLRRIGVLLLLVASAAAVAMQLILHDLATAGKTTVTTTHEYGENFSTTVSTQSIHLHWPIVFPAILFVAGCILVLLSVLQKPAPPPLPRELR